MEYIQYSVYFKHSYRMVIIKMYSEVYRILKAYWSLLNDSYNNDIQYFHDIIHAYDGIIRQGLNWFAFSENVMY